MPGSFGRMGVKFGGMGGAGSGASDLIAPTLTSPIDSSLTDTTGSLGVTTDEANGTLYYVVTTSATPPSATQVKAGQNNGGTAAVYAGNQVITTTGAKTATATGLTEYTQYYTYFMHEDAAGNQSSVAAADGFITTGDREFILMGDTGPVYINENGARSEILSGAAYLTETS